MKMGEIGQNNKGMSIEKADTAEIFQRPSDTNIMVYHEQKHVQNALEDNQCGQCLAVDDPHVSKAEPEMSQLLSKKQTSDQGIS